MCAPMPAQAQRCFYEKAVADQMSPKLLSKIAAQIGIHYKEVYTTLCTPTLGSHIGSGWSELVESNKCMFEGLAQQHASYEHAAVYAYGQQVACLAFAAERTAHATALAQRQAPPLRQVYIEASAAASAAHTQAARDNENVYGAQAVPPRSALPAVLPHVMVKLLEISEITEPLSAQQDPFVHLVPARTLREVEACEAAARQQQAEMQARLLRLEQQGAARLSELDLPHALQAVEQGKEALSLPAKLQKDVISLHRSGGEAALRSALAELRSLAERSDERSSGLRALMQAEEQRDFKMRCEHGRQWELLTSCDLAELQAELAGIRERLLVANEANEANEAKEAEEARLAKEVEEARLAEKARLVKKLTFMIVAPVALAAAADFFFSSSASPQ